MTPLDECRLYLGTDDGLRVLDADGGDPTAVASALAGSPVRDVAVDPDDGDRAWFGAALGGWGLHRTADGGATVETVGFEDRWVWGVDRLPDGDLYVGTEPPGLFRAEDGATFAELDGVHDVAGRDDWRFGYEPFEAGHVHGCTAHPDRPGRLFAAVEIGGVLVSDDGGDSWRAALRGADVHRLAVDPADPDRVVAATESGVYESHDGGRTWECVGATEGLYVKFVVFGPGGACYAPAAADMGDTTVRLFVGDEGTWERRATVDGASVLAFAVVDGTLLLQRADDGRLLASDDGGRSWTPVGPALPRVRAIAAADR